MTTLILVENALGSGQDVRLTEAFGDDRVTHDLRPGETARLVISPFKSISLSEATAKPAHWWSRSTAAKRTAVHEFPSALQRRSG